MRGAFGVPAVAMIAACAPVGDMPTAEDGQHAEAVVSGVILDRVPSYRAAVPAATCVRENATDEEIMILSGRRGPKLESDLTSLAFAIINRPPTRACIEANNIPPLG